MLHILFLILKIIGILLLCLLGLLILLVLAVLFVPVRYHAEGESRTASPGTYIKGTVSWLLHLVHFSAVYQNGETSLRVRLLGIPLWKNGAEKSPGHSRKSRKEKPSEPSPKDEDQDAQEQAEADRQALDEPVTTETELSCPQQQEEAGEEKEQWASPGLWSRIREKGKAFFAGISQLRSRISQIREKLSRTWKRILQYRDWIGTESAKQALFHCGRELRDFLKHIRPRKCRVSLRFGTGDPASTGQILGAVALFYPATKGQLRIDPDFQEKILEGSFKLSGRMFSCKLAAACWRLFRDRQIRTAYGQWKQQ